MDYLALRQQLKETFRTKLRKETGYRDGKTTTPADNYGSFFGPSEIAFSSRVVEESKSLVENLQPAMKQHRKKLETQSGDVKAMLWKTLERTEKIKKIKEGRDYSFLFSDDCDISVSGKKELFVQDNPASDQLSEKITKKFSPENSRPVGTDKKGSGIPTGNISMNIPSPSRWEISKVAMDKPKDLATKSCDLKKSLGQKRKSDETGEIVLKQARRNSGRVSQEAVERGNRKHERSTTEENAIDIIRRIFRYDPAKYRDDRDDKSMEASFADIQREERRSAKLASKEDAKELRKLKQENKRNANKMKFLG